MKKFLPKIWKALPESEFLRGILVWLVTQKFLAGVAAIILNNQGQILLFQHTYRKKKSWGLPGGYVKRGELPAQALKREIMEESGLQVKVTKPLIISGDDQWPRIDLVFLCQILSEDFKSSDEVSAMKFFELDDLPELIRSQRKIIDHLRDSGELD